MSKLALMGEMRDSTKKKSLKALRREGYVPGILYGRNIENKNIKIRENDLKRTFNYCNVGSKVELNIGNEGILTLVKNIQYHAVKGNIIHIDFQELTKGEKIRVKIPIHLTNKSSVESNTMVVQEQLKEIEIQTLPEYLPDNIEVDACVLDSKESITVADLDIYNNKDIEILSEPEQVIATLAYASKQEAAVTEEDTFASLTDL
ncbi:50S ribosomal protein L25 [Maledivibacter halophilus]|uniref:Large ribosomal subunit protein bL25 n=1 Tax=Maledivibacter halophilus TaxID=36842 RepID=A0A1T5M9P1_9FIRM|nr:50S ribosomal protein L25 [Maledivibacter halophilus]SKC84855.1 large subunit ribosomal protein L25 [Maledivibacter halophilus]